jgi:hypothetical protein
MFRDARYKLIAYNEIPANAPRTDTTSGSNRVQLFDLVTDPWETVNLADDPGYGIIRTRLEHGLREWQASIGDELLKLPPVS